jgi:hypothetical protein
MSEVAPGYSASTRVATALLAVVLLLLPLGSAWSQNVTSASSSASAASPQTAQPASSSPPSSPANPPQPPQPDTRITKAQAKDLFRSVDDILRFASHDSGLPIKHKVKRNLITRESVEKYVDTRMKDDKDAQRLEQSRLVLEKFGLIPPRYDLHAAYLRLIGEQVAAYYDPRTKSVNLLDWVAPDVQRPVLAHELTHALQDQKIGLEKWELAGGRDDKPLPDQQEQSVEEAQSARQCVAEGQAMVVLLDYTLAPMGKDVASAPEAIDVMRASMADTGDSPVFAAAPMFLQESLLLPYNFGLDFVRAVLISKGKQAAYAGMLENPPIDTRQIMEPETYLASQAVPPLAIPDLDKLIAPDYERFDFGGMGEFDIYLLAKQYGAEHPRDYYSHWRGGYYLATREKTAPKDKIGLVYLSRWDSPQAAGAFSKLYASYLPKRYKKPIERQVVAADSAGTRGVQQRMTYDTESGTVTLETRGNDLLIMESLGDKVAERARAALLQNSQLLQSAASGGR